MNLSSFTFQWISLKFYQFFKVANTSLGGLQVCVGIYVYIHFVWTFHGGHILIFKTHFGSLLEYVGWGEADEQQTLDLGMGPASKWSYLVSEIAKILPIIEEYQIDVWVQWLNQPNHLRIFSLCQKIYRIVHIFWLWLSRYLFSRQSMSPEKGSDLVLRHPSQDLRIETEARYTDSIQYGMRILVLWKRYPHQKERDVITALSHPLNLSGKGPYQFPTLLNTLALITWPSSPLLSIPLKSP